MAGRRPLQLYTKILIGMGLGGVLGLLFGPTGALMPEDAVRFAKGDVRQTPESSAAVVPLAAEARSAPVIEHREGWAKVEIRLKPRSLVRLRTEGVEGADEARAGQRVDGWVSTQAQTVRAFSHWGQLAVDWTEWIGALFLALIKMVVVPLVFFSLIVGVASLGDVRKLGRLGVRTLGFFTLTTVVALTIGVTLTNVLEPGKLLAEDDRAALLASYEGAASSTMSRAAVAPSLMDQIVGIVPTNPIASLAAGEMLQVIFFALMLGIALTLLPEERSRPMVQMVDTANEAMVMLVHIAMKLAPVGVAALIFKVIGSTGLSVLVALGAYAMTVMLGLIFHVALTYASVVRFGGGLKVLEFLRGLRPAMLLAFSTSSSSATLPVTKECVEDNLGVPPSVSSFVLPLGATVNMDGTALYQGVAAIFIAQIYGLGLDLSQQLTIITSATLASVGAAGVPGAGLVTLAMVLTTVGIPAEGLALILGVDRLLDMMRTTTNVVGDSTGTVFIAKLEGARLGLTSAEEDFARADQGFENRVKLPKP
ncbi:MAG: dicarboxylate/amino acid:cation symporter [Myxococcota bacterium]